jgi:hypothetical protein
LPPFLIVVQWPSSMVESPPVETQDSTDKFPGLVARA